MKKIITITLIFLSLTNFVFSNKTYENTIMIGKVKSITEIPERNSFNDDVDIFLDKNYLFPNLGYAPKVIKQTHDFRCNIEIPNIGEIVIYEIEKPDFYGNILYSKTKIVGDCSEQFISITCNNDEFYTYSNDYLQLKNIGEPTYKELINYYKNGELNTENIKNTLKKEIKTCENFEKIFDIKLKNKLSYKYKKNYKEKKINYMKILQRNEKFVLNSMKYKKEYISKIRNNTEKNKYYSEEKKEKINIILDAVLEFIY